MDSAGFGDRRLHTAEVTALTTGDARFFEGLLVDSLPLSQTVSSLRPGHEDHSPNASLTTFPSS